MRLGPVFLSLDLLDLNLFLMHYLLFNVLRYFKVLEVLVHVLFYFVQKLQYSCVSHFGIPAICRAHGIEIFNDPFNLLEGSGIYCLVFLLSC